jgi:hypothetical protein
MGRPAKVPGSLMMLLNIPMLMFVNLLSCKIGTNVCVEILWKKKLLHQWNA